MLCIAIPAEATFTLYINELNADALEAGRWLSTMGRQQSRRAKEGSRAHPTSSGEAAQRAEPQLLTKPLDSYPILG